MIGTEYLQSLVPLTAILFTQPLYVDIQNNFQTLFAYIKYFLFFMRSKNIFI